MQAPPSSLSPDRPAFPLRTHVSIEASINSPQAPFRNLFSADFLSLLDRALLAFCFLSTKAGWFTDCLPLKLDRFLPDDTLQRPASSSSPKGPVPEPLITQSLFRFGGGNERLEGDDPPPHPC